MVGDNLNQDQSKTDERVRTFTFNLAVPPGERYPRYFHYSFGRGEKQGSRPARLFATFPRIDLQTLPPPPISFTHGIELGAEDQTIIEAPCCIYCGATKYVAAGERLPTDEHIIPEGIGGNLLIKNASCQVCANKIGRFENWIQLRQFDLVRTSLGIRGKKKRAETETNARIPTFNEAMDSFVTRKISFEKMPSCVFLPVFEPPGRLCSRPPLQHGLAKLWVHKIEKADDFARGRMNNFFLPELDTIRFSQLLCKIAYGYAAAYLGIPHYIAKRTAPIGTKRSAMLEFFLHTPAKRDTAVFQYEFVGGFPDNFAPSKYLHELNFRSTVFEGTIYHIVDIRLFAILGAPIYSVIVGWQRI